MLRYHVSPFATYLEKKKKIQKIDNVFCIDTLGKQILSFLDNGKAKWYSLYKGELAISQKFSFSYWPRNPTFKYLSPPKITKYEKLYPYFAKYKLALFGIAKKWKQPICSAVGCRLHKQYYVPAEFSKLWKGYEVTSKV